MTQLGSTISAMTLCGEPGLRNHRFQRVAFHFKANAFYEGKTGFWCEIVAVAEW